MKKIVLFISLSLLILVGCEHSRDYYSRDYKWNNIYISNNNFKCNNCTSNNNYKCNNERIIWINSDVECCGVKDPLNNLGWLKEKSRFYEYNEAPLNDYNYIFLYRNTLTDKDHIVVNYYYSRVSWVIIYDCEGNLIDGGGYSILKRVQIVNREFLSEGPEPCDTCDEFFQTHVLMDTISYLIIKP